MNLGNDVPQSIIANHVFQRLIRRLTYFLSFWFICCVDCYFPIGTISDDIKHSPIPLKFNLSTPVDAALKFTDGFKIHTAIWNNYFIHAKHLAEVLKFWCTIRIIDRRTWNRMFIWIIPANSVVMWVRMLISTVVICLMPFHFRPPIRPHFCLANITVIHYRSFDFSGISQIALVLRLIGIWSPFSTISASAAFTDPCMRPLYHKTCDLRHQFYSSPNLHGALPSGHSPCTARNCVHNPHTRCLPASPETGCCSK